MYQENQRDASRLEPNFRAAYERALAVAASRGVTMKPYCYERSIFEQCRLWRQSRSGWEVRQMIQKMESRGAKFVAWALNEVGPQAGSAGRHVTWTLFSYHALGEAVDAFWQVGNKASWSTRTGGANNGYRVFRQACVEQGLGHLRGDWPHIQSPHASPIKRWGYKGADEFLQKKYDYR